MHLLCLLVASFSNQSFWQFYILLYDREHKYNNFLEKKPTLSCVFVTQQPSVYTSNSFDLWITTPELYQLHEWSKNHLSAQNNCLRISNPNTRKVTFFWVHSLFPLGKYGFEEVRWKRTLGWWGAALQSIETKRRWSCSHSFCSGAYLLGWRSMFQRNVALIT